LLFSDDAPPNYKLFMVIDAGAPIAGILIVVIEPVVMIVHVKPTQLEAVLKLLDFVTKEGIKNSK